MEIIVDRHELRSNFSESLNGFPSFELFFCEFFAATSLAIRFFDTSVVNQFRPRRCRKGGNRHVASSPFEMYQECLSQSQPTTKTSKNLIWASRESRCL